MKYRIIDIRYNNFNVLEYKISKNQKLDRCGSMIEDFTYQILANINCEFYVENTNVIGVNIYNLAEKDATEKEKGLKSNENYKYWLGRLDHIGGIMEFIDVEFLIYETSINEVHKYLVNWITNILVSYGNQFNEETEMLAVGKQKLIENEYYIQVSSKKIKTRDKNYEVWLEVLMDFELDHFRLVLFNVETEGKEFFNISSKKPWRTILKEAYIGHEDDFVYRIENPVTHYFELDGWKKGNIFCFHWGEEKYEFDLKNRKMNIL